MNNMYNREGRASDSSLNRNVAAGEDAHPLITEEAPCTITHDWMESSHNFFHDDEIPAADIFSFMSGMQDHLQPPTQMHTETISVERSTLCQQEKPQRPSSNPTHSAAEKRRRDKFKEKIKLLEELLPNCTKKDTTSILDEAIKYIRLLKNQVERFEASYFSFGGSQISPMHAEMAPPTFIPTRLASVNVIGQVGFGAGANAGISPMHAAMVSPTFIIPTRLVNANAIDIGAGADAETTLNPTMLPSPLASTRIQMLVPQMQTHPFHMASSSAVDTTSTSFATGGSSSCVQASNASD